MAIIKLCYGSLMPDPSEFLEKISNQTKDNLVYVFLSAIPIWTAYEVITYWLFANSFIPMIDWNLYPVYCAILFFLVPTIRDIHFYLEILNYQNN